MTFRPCPSRALPALSALALAALAATGCAPIAAGAIGTAGVAMVQERSVGDAVDDAAIRIRVNDLWIRNAPELLKHVDKDVVEGRVLLTGAVPTPELRVEAVRLTWQADGVKEVVNEIQVSKDGTIGDYARDAWITTQLRSKILFDRDIASVNYNVETVGSVVYLMGIARDQRELDKVLAHARSIAYVTRVVSYVRLRDELPGARTPATAAPAPVAPTTTGGPVPTGSAQPPVSSAPLPPPTR